MKKKLLITLAFANLSIIPVLYSQATAFEGVIKYVPLNNERSSPDSMIVYFGKNRIKIVRTGALIEKFGGVVEEFVDFEKLNDQTTIIYNYNRGMEVINNSKSGIASTKYYPDSVKIILGFTCTKVDLIFETAEFSGGIHTLTISNWNTSSSCIGYLVPDTANFSQFHANYSRGGIPLYFTRTVNAKLVDGTDYFKSTTMIACEIIIKKLSDDLFTIHKK